MVRVLFFVSFILLNCNFSKSFDLVNSEWGYNYAEGCEHTLSFSEKPYYESYNCEMDLSNFGRYEQKGDTLLLYELGYLDDGVQIIEENDGLLYKVLMESESKMRFFQRLEKEEGDYFITFDDFSKDYCYIKR